MTIKKKKTRVIAAMLCAVLSLIAFKLPSFFIPTKTQVSAAVAYDKYYFGDFVIIDDSVETLRDLGLSGLYSEVHNLSIPNVPIIQMNLQIFNSINQSIGKAVFNNIIVRQDEAITIKQDSTLKIETAFDDVKFALIDLNTALDNSTLDNYFFGLKNNQEMNLYNIYETAGATKNSQGNFLIDLSSKIKLLSTPFYLSENIDKYNFSKNTGFVVVDNDSNLSSDNYNSTLSVANNRVYKEEGYNYFYIGDATVGYYAQTPTVPNPNSESGAFFKYQRQELPGGYFKQGGFYSVGEPIVIKNSGLFAGQDMEGNSLLWQTNTERVYLGNYDIYGTYAIDPLYALNEGGLNGFMIDVSSYLEPFYGSTSILGLGVQYSNPVAICETVNQFYENNTIENDVSFNGFMIDFSPCVNDIVINDIPQEVAAQYTWSSVITGLITVIGWPVLLPIAIIKGINELANGGNFFDGFGDVFEDINEGVNKIINTARKPVTLGIVLAVILLAIIVIVIIKKRRN